MLCFWRKARHSEDVSEPVWDDVAVAVYEEKFQFPLLFLHKVPQTD